MADLIALAVVALVIFLIAIAAYQNYRKAGRRQAGWRTLAAANGLTFTPGSFWWGGAYVTGIYRRRQVKLETIHKGRGSPEFTHVSVSIAESRARSSDEAGGDGWSPTETVNRFTSLETACLRLRGQISAAAGARQIIYESVGIEENVDYLQTVLDRLVDLAEVYAAIAPLGGEAIPALLLTAKDKANVLHRVARTLLEEIAEENFKRFAGRVSAVLCARCLAAYTLHQVHLSGLPWRKSVTYYGCRLCSHSRQFLPADEGVVAVLDRQMSERYTAEAGLVRVNWLARRELFDFNRVEIVEATDSDVERFILRMGNDTDPFRQALYQDMSCRVSAQADLSENTMRILRRTFGKVEIVPSRKGR